ncbi:conserved oligomeric Golgi complex subunit 2-like isoform X1 [Branchiostoma floridae]|uniref:Conserved oligomeric Golgi complex subunit 2 n=1 Tax=Branchiostoma floridae TaxID=7739 RepID=A0A9J7M2M2_BRAFL|nr:conserved oligomeric Golgi complex subunit 2-like isoform X1 [Branchiostoma floridae]
MALTTLPISPRSLCFDKDVFMKENFDVDQFVAECRRRVSLETLREDLEVYYKLLRSAMIELINKDYADFVNLSTNLVGMDKAINNLSVPLGQLREEVMQTVRTAMDTAVQEIENRLATRAAIRDKKACLQRLMNITHSVEKIEKILDIQDQGQGDGERELTGQLIERVATEFNQLQFYVTQSKGLPLVEKIRPRIAAITTTLQHSLETSFLEGLRTSNRDILRQCLRTYATIDKIKDAEALFRQTIVRPYMEEVITEAVLMSHPQGLRGLYSRVLDFIPAHCKPLREVTTGLVPSSAQGEVVRGYDFLVNAVWPEVIAGLEKRTPSIFAPGNPSMFHQKYLTSMNFLDAFELECGSQASVKRLRSHPSYNTFMTKWSLPVYYQIRFQEIGGALETSLMSPFNNASDKTLFQLNAPYTLWQCMAKCWAQDIYLSPLCHRFWKLTLQLLARYSTWVKEIREKEIPRKETDQTGESSTGTPSTTNALMIYTPTMTTVTTTPASLASTPGPPSQGTAPSTPLVTMTQMVCLVTDSDTIINKVDEFFSTVVQPKVAAIGVKNTDVLTDALGESKELISQELPGFGDFIVQQIAEHCVVNLKPANDIPRLYRRTNREVPSKASSYVSATVKPLQMFLEEHAVIISATRRSQWVVSILKVVTERYYSVTDDILTAVRKMEDSLKRLKKLRKGDSGNSSSSGGMSDDDKIRLQLVLDVKQFGEEIQALSVPLDAISTYRQLLELVESAQTSATQAQ